MANRQRPDMVATRVTTREKALIQFAADSEGTTVSELLHRLVVPAVRERIAKQLEADDSPN